MNSKKFSPTNKSSQNNANRPMTSEEQSDVLHDYYNPEIKSLTDIEHLSVANQLKYLSNVAEAADADMLYSSHEAHNVLSRVAKSRNFSPLIRVVAYSFNPDTSDENHTDDSVADEEFGYYSIVTPDMMPNGVLTKEEGAMNEEELRAELEKLAEDEEIMPDEIESGSEEEETLRQYISQKEELEFALKMLFFRRNQTRLHSEFPSAPKNKQLVKIAPDAVATLDFEQKYDDEESWFTFGSSIDSILYGDGYGDISPETKTLSYLDDESILYLKIVHGNTKLKSSISAMINIDLNRIPLESQICLLKYMAKSDDGRFDRLCETLHGISDEKLRLKLAESFVAADFGEDFGDSLLDIANSTKISSEQLREILGQIETCRESIGKVGETLYKGYDDGKFANEYVRAANERLTDAITVFREIALNGRTEADLGHFGRVSLDYEQAMEALKYEVASLSIIGGTLSDVSTGKDGAFAEVVLSPEEGRERSLYNFYSPDYGYVLLYTRPEASNSFDPSLEYGKPGSRYKNGVNIGVEASISLTVNPVSPFASPNPYRPNPQALKNPNFYDPSTMDKVSAIRVDREGIEPGMPANSPERDPLNYKGRVSVDLAAINDRKDTPSGKIARLFSVGNYLRSSKMGISSTLNHNTNWFDQDEYGTADGFSNLVGHVDVVVREWCAKMKPDLEDDDTESFTKQFRQKNKNRGRKTRAA